MDIKVYHLPTQNDEINVIEKRYNELEVRYRNGEKLDEIEIDWLDTANTWLLTSGD